MAKCYNYTVKIFYRAGAGSEREKQILEAAKEYACDPGPHLIDRLLADRLELFVYRKQKAQELAERELKLAEERRQLMGGKT